MIDIDVKNTSTVDVLDSITTNITTNVVPTVDTTNDLQIEINRKEYSIVGDELYIPKRYEEAPQWLRDLIDTVVGTAIDLKVQDLNTLDSIFNTLIAELEVAKNTYTQSIISSNDIDERINTAITTLNSTLADADSTILDTALARATPEEVNTIATGILSASLLNGDIKAQIDTLQSAIATLDSARVLDYTALESAIAGGLEDEATARAAAVQYLDTYVGITDGTPNGTGLLADVEILQKQNDGVIETYTDIYDVMLNPQDPNTAELITTAEPYATWVSTDTTNGNADIRLAHIGDIYVKYQTTANGAKEYIASYKFVKTIVDSTSPYATDTEGFTWALIVDQASQAAFEQALNAYDLADNKRRVFTSTPYGPYDVGDLWTRDINGSSQIWRASADRVTGYLESEWSQVATDDQYAIDIVNGTNQIDLSEHIDSLGWNTSINTLASDVSSINLDLAQKAIDIANLDGAITAEETARISAILAEETARIADIQARIDEEARLDGLITTEEQARIDAVAAVDIAYKEYVRIVTLSLADGVLTQTEQDAIASAQAAVDLAKQRLLDIETNVSTLFNDISNINTTTAQQALDIANLDNAITSEETARIQAVLDEETARIAAINDRITEEARLDGLITDEEAARIQAITDVEAAYKEYSRVVTLAIADGVLTPTEQALISAAATEVEAAKQRLLDIEANANAYSDSILNNFVTVTYAADLLDTRNQIDGKADTYFQGTEPYSFASLTAEEKSAKDGDVWYDTTPTNGVEAYRFSEISGWVKIEDTQTLQALSDASLAQATADGKVQNFTSEPTHPYYVGDTWMQGSTGDIYVCNTDSTGTFNQSHWTIASRYGEELDAFISEVNDTIVPSIQNQIDAKLEYWFTLSTDDPKDTWTVAERPNRDGDVWYQTDTKLSYYYVSSTNSWLQIQDADALQAIQAAADAQGTADGRVSHMFAWYGNTTPTSTYKYWLKLDNQLYYQDGTLFPVIDLDAGDVVTAYDGEDMEVFTYTGTTWALATNGGGMIATSKAVTELSTELNNGTTTWASSDSTLSNTLTTKIENDDAIVEGKFEYGSNITINGITQSAGFGLVNELSSVNGAPAAGQSEFWINAAKFKFTNDNVTGQAAPFTIDASGTQPKITFNGLVTFGSGQTGTIDEAIASTVETIAVGDKNINITDNLIPTTSLVADTDNSGYQFVGTPTKGNTAGIDTFAEAQIVLDTGDEVYSPYVDEMTIPYYYRFGFKGSDLSIFKITTIDNLDVATYNTVTVQLDTALVGTNWYIIDGIINPTGGDNVSYSGSVKLPDGTKVGSIQNFVLPSGTVKLVLGWVEPCTISRMKLAKITADTITNAYATQDYVQNQGYVLPAGVADAINNNTTTINGSKITTGSIAAEKINTQGLIAENISADTIYGKTLSGSIINGARINGAVIKASYLDLDGQLEVLTNYHLCTSTAQLNAIISAGGTGRLVTNADKIDFGGDAVYITADNEWRIPSLRAVSSTGVYLTQTYAYPFFIPVPAGELHSSIYSYNYTTAGSNIKAVKQAPPISINYSHPAVDTVVSNNSRRYYLYIGTKKLIAYTSTSSTAYSITSDYPIVYNGSVSTTIGSKTGTAYHYTINGNIKVSVETYNSSGFQGISLLFDHIYAINRPESYTVTSNLLFESGNIYCSYDDSASVGLPAISIDNMV